MRAFFPVLLSALFILTIFFQACGPGEQDKEDVANLKHRSDSIDSVAVVIAAQKRYQDSANQIDFILRDSCPELKEYIRLNKSAIAIIDSVGSNKTISKKYDLIVDSIEKEKDRIMDKKFVKMNVVNQMRFIHLSMLYTNILTGSLMKQAGLSPIEVEPNDSLVWKIVNGK